MTRRGLVRALGASLLAGLPAMTGCDRPTPAPSAILAVPAPAPAKRIRYRDGHYPSLDLAQGRRREIKSLLNIGYPMLFGGFAWDEEGVPQGETWVLVDLGRQLISVFRQGHEIGSAVIIFGSDGKPTPTGAFTVLQKAKDYTSRTYDAPMPFMLRLTGDGVAIHGSHVRQGWATHGCVGVPLEFARLLYAAMNLGGRVEILPQGGARAPGQTVRLPVG